MRRPLVLAVLLGTTSTASATSPAHPICDAEDGELGFVVEGPLGGGPATCAVRWISPGLRPGGVTFELVRDGIVVETQLDAEAADERQPERRHECDGSVTDTFRVLASYSATFPDALDGDAIHISDASGALGTTYIVADGTCPPIDWATYECQVCAPDGPPAFGCLSASRGGGAGAPWGVVAVGVALMLGRLGRAGRRARTAARPRAARPGRPD